MISSQAVLTGSFTPPDTHHELLREVRRGLLERPRSLVPWMFYDEQGSQLFERITALPEYYPSRTEYQILTTSADAIFGAVGAGKRRKLRVVELGAGMAAKTCILLDAATRRQADVHYLPVDVSPDALSVACKRLERFAGVQVEPIVANYVDSPPHLADFDGVTLVIYLGSSVGNFVPEEARAILRSFGRQLKPEDRLVLGVDLVKEESRLVAAYDDAEGVTAQFNLNVLHRLNQELGADFDLDGFRHRALWNAVESRVEMHLECTCDQVVSIEAAELEIPLVCGETIHTENSYKFTDHTLGELLNRSGFELNISWKDERDWYAVSLARPLALIGKG